MLFLFLCTLGVVWRWRCARGRCGAGATQRLCRHWRGGRMISRSSGGVRLARGGLLRGSWDGTDTVNQGGSR